MGLILRSGFLALLLACGMTDPARAQDETVPVRLTEVLTMARAYPNLVQQVRLELVAAGLKREDVTCRARRLAAQYGKLAGVGVAPYWCKIGRRTLEVTSRLTFHDANGHKLNGDDPAAAARAVRLTQSNLAWRWR